MRRNELVEAYMKEHGCTRATAYRKLKVASVSPTVSEKTSTVSKTVSSVSIPQPSQAIVSQTFELGPGSSKAELPRRIFSGPARPNPLAERYNKAVEAKYGKLLPSTETFTLMDGTVIPIYRREFPNGNRPKSTGREGDRVE